MNQFKLLLITLFLSPSLFAQPKLTDKIPVDPEVKIGKLSNGLTYYIRQNAKPENKVELRLVINAGSILEDENQQGIAHLAEHMAFNGTKNFKKNDIISFLQSIGVTFGNDLNAYTGFDETVYILPIPVDKPANIEKGFQILEDWAHNVTYDNKDIDDERPVILEESRLGKGARDRILHKIFPNLLAGSLYADRLPIGKDSIVKNAKYDVIKKFYKDWYRPNLMAVIVVGDIDTKQAEALIKKHFGALKNPVKERERFMPVVPAYKKSVASVVTDKEATNYSFLVNYSAQQTKPSTTLSDYKKELVKSIFTELLNQRLRELTQQENSPFIYAYTSFSSYARGFEAFNANIVTGDKSNVDGLKAFEVELARAKKFGFLQAELDRVKTSLLNSIERSYKEKDKTESANYAGEYVRNFLEKEPIPGIQKEAEYYKELLPLITLTEVNAVAKSLDQNNNQYIALTGPEPKAGENIPTSDNLLALRSEVSRMDIKPYEEKVIASSLMEKMPEKGAITSSKNDAALGTTDFVLSNGVTVTIKPTKFKNDQILMSAVRPGGKNNYDLKDKFNAEYLIPVISSMGVGEFSPVDLKKVLTGKTVGVSPVFGEYSEGISGSSSVKDLESMLQLTNLYFTAPRKDTGLYRSFLQKNKAQLAFLSANPQVVFIDSLFNTFYHNSPLAPVAVPKPDYFDKINLDRLMEIYQERFGDANEMHFTFVGSLDESVLKPLLEKYIASLPATKKDFHFVDNKLRPVEGRHDVNVYKGAEQKALIMSIYTGEVPYSEELELKAKAISEILNIIIIEELREKIKGIYGGGTQMEVSKIPYSNYSFFLQLPCGPEKVDTLLQAANTEIQSLVKNGPSKENLDKVKQQWIEQYKTGIKENGTWLSQLQSFTFPGGSPEFFLNYEKHVQDLTPKDIQEVAKLLFSTNNVVTGILRPEQKP